MNIIAPISTTIGNLLCRNISWITICLIGLATIMQSNAQDIDLKTEGKNTYSFSLNPDKLTLTHMAADLDDVNGDSVTVNLTALTDGGKDNPVSGVYWIKANAALINTTFNNGKAVIKLDAAQQSSIVFTNLQDEPLVELSLFSWFKILQKAVVFAVLFYIFRYILTYIQKRMYKAKQTTNPIDPS